MGSTPSVCLNGHVMNLDYTFCQVCNARASTDNSSTDINTQTADETANPNDITDETQNLDAADQ
jgi:hypothetical protein